MEEEKEPNKIEDLEEYSNQVRKIGLKLREEILFTESKESSEENMTNEVAELESTYDKLKIVDIEELAGDNVKGGKEKVALNKSA